MFKINSSGKPAAHDVMNACDYLVINSARFLKGSQGNAIRLIKEWMEERGVSKGYNVSTLRKFAKMYRIAARILDGSSSNDNLRWFAKNMQMQRVSVHILKRRSESSLATSGYKSYLTHLIPSD